MPRADTRSIHRNKDGNREAETKTQSIDTVEDRETEKLVGEVETE